MQVHTLSELNVMLAENSIRCTAWIGSHVRCAAVETQYSTAKDA